MKEDVMIIKTFKISIDTHLLVITFFYKIVWEFS